MVLEGITLKMSIMFDQIVNEYGSKKEKQLLLHILHLLHRNESNQLLIINKIKAMSKDFIDLKASVDAVKLDISDIKTKVGTVIDKLPKDGGMTAEEVAELKAELGEIHGTGQQVEANLDNAINPPVENPPVDNPPADNPPVDNPPVETEPVEGSSTSETESATQ